VKQDLDSPFAALVVRGFKPKADKPTESSKGRSKASVP